MKVKCRVCKNYFSKEEVLYKLPLGNICTKECMAILKTSNTVKKKTQTKKQRDNDIPPETRAKVLSRDGYRCRRCGSNRFIDIHHIHYRSEYIDHNENNLIVLCVNCHIPIIHSNKKYFQPLLLELIDLGNTGRFLSLIQLERLKANGSGSEF